MIVIKSQGVAIFLGWPTFWVILDLSLGCPGNNNLSDVTSDCQTTSDCETN